MNYVTQAFFAQMVCGLLLSNILAGNPASLAQRNVKLTNRSRINRPELARLQKRLSALTSFSSQSSGTTSEPSLDDKNIFNGMRMLSEVIAHIEQRGFKKPDFAKFFEQALGAAVPYDTHSAFYSKEAYKNMMESTAGKFSGIGVTITSKNPDDLGLTIVEVLDGGPASEAKPLSDDDTIIGTPGLQPGDQIVEANNEKLKGLSTDEAINKLKGPTGSTVTVKIIRNKKMLEYSIVRGEVTHEVSHCYAFKDYDVYYISLRMFSENATSLIEENIQHAINNNARGMIIDLRRNPGGVLDIVVDIAGLFIPKGSLVVYTKDGKGNEVSSYKTAREPIFNSSMPIFVLIDNFTASASEILASTLRIYSEQSAAQNGPKLNVFILGTQSYGKGSVQEVIPISNGCALKLTTMLYYMPDKTAIQAAGVTPDFVVEQTHKQTSEDKVLQSFHGREDAQKNHISRADVQRVDQGESVQNNTPQADTPTSTKKEDEHIQLTPAQKKEKKIAEDNQIKAAITMINLLHAARPEQVATRTDALKFLSSVYVTDKELSVTRIPSKAELEKKK